MVENAEHDILKLVRSIKSQINEKEQKHSKIIVLFTEDDLPVDALKFELNRISEEIKGLKMQKQLATWKVGDMIKTGKFEITVTSVEKRKKMQNSYQR